MTGRQTATPRDFHAGSFTVRPDVHHDTLHQKADDLLALGRARLGSMPKRRNVAFADQDFVLTLLSKL